MIFHFNHCLESVEERETYTQSRNVCISIEMLVNQRFLKFRVGSKEKNKRKSNCYV